MVDVKEKYVASCSWGKDSTAMILNLKELRNIYKYLPEYWAALKGLQDKIDSPFRKDGQTVFDLEERFKNEI